MSNTTTTPIEYDLPTPPPGPVTFDEYVAWFQCEGVRAEWVDGEIIVMSPDNLDHARLNLFLAQVIKDFVEAHGLGEVFPPALIRLRQRPRGRVPDVVFVATRHADRLGPTYIEGAADLAVEIVSPDSIARDHTDKLAEYQAAGIGEYWLIDPLEQRATFYHLQPDGAYQPAPIDADGVYRSAVVPGFWLNVAWLWQRPLPPVATIRRHLGL